MTRSVPIVGLVVATVLLGCDGDSTDDDGLTAATTDDGTSAATEQGTQTTAASGDTGTTTTGAQTDEAGSASTHDASSTGGSGEDATTTTDADTSATAAETGDDGGVVPECEALQDCCDQIGPDLYAGCSTVVENGDAGLCDQILNTYHQDGYCTGETWCEDLAACCGDLPAGPGWAETCWYYAELGNQPQCAMLIGDYQLSGYCF